MRGGTLSVSGSPIEIRYAAGLRDSAGNAAHAATFIRQRLIVLDDELRSDPREHERILLHELFHFVWVRLGNPRRLEWEQLLGSERGQGEAGWSAEWRKRALHRSDRKRRSRKWREYCCESFCDTAARVLGGPNAEATLKPELLRRRALWFRELLREPLSI